MNHGGLESNLSTLMGSLRVRCSSGVKETTTSNVTCFVPTPTDRSNASLHREMILNRMRHAPTAQYTMVNDRLRSDLISLLSIISSSLFVVGMGPKGEHEL